MAAEQNKKDDMQGAVQNGISDHDIERKDNIDIAQIAIVHKDAQFDQSGKNNQESDHDKEGVNINVEISPNDVNEGYNQIFTPTGEHDHDHDKMDEIIFDDNRQEISNDQNKTFVFARDSIHDHSEGIVP